MRDRLTELGDNTAVVLITFSDLGSIDRYRRQHDLPFAVLTDPGRKTYRAYGLGRGSVARVWGLRAAREYARLIKRNGWGGLHKPSEDTLQLGGDFIVAQDGTLAWGFWGEGPDDRPTVEEIIRETRKLSA